MGSTLWLLSGLAVVAAPLPTETPRPASGPPRIIFVEQADKARMELRLLEVEQVPVTRQVTENAVVGGKAVQVARNVVVSVPIHKISLLSMKNVVVYDTEGKVVGPDTYWKQLKGGAVVLLSNHKVDPTYLKCIRPETLILVQQNAGDGPVVPERIIPAPIPIKKPPQ